MANTPIQKRVIRTFILPAILFTLIILGSILLARWYITTFFVPNTLREEASFFWYRMEQGYVAPPITKNISAFIAPRENPEALPRRFQKMGVGTHKLPEYGKYFGAVHIEDNGPWRIVIVFTSEDIDRVALYFILMPLLLISLLVYLFGWGAFRRVTEAISPVTELANRVDMYNPADPHSELFDPDYFEHDPPEYGVLANALRELTERTQLFAEREHQFTRDISHELRSPLTVIQMTCEKLLMTASAKQKTDIERILRNAKGMTELSTALLQLAREEEFAAKIESLSVWAQVEQSLDSARVQFAQKSIKSSIEGEDFIVEAPQRVLSIIFDNLIRNAYTYTDKGQIQVQLKPSTLSVTDTGIGMSEEQVSKAFQPFQKGPRRGGHGVGLTIVKTMCSRFGWVVDIESTIDIGTCVTIKFKSS